MLLPPEIIDLILESVAQDPQGPNIDALKACNLTSSTFSEICEPHLYACVYLCRDNTNRTGNFEQLDPYDPQCRMSVNRFTKTLANKPHISRHVKRLGILLLNSGGIRRDHIDDWWQTVAKAVIHIPLDRIEWFRYSSNVICQFSDMHIDLQQSLVKIISSPALETLHLHGPMYFPLCDAVSPQHTIRHMDIGSCSLAKSSTDDWELKTFTLNSLVIRPGEEIITKLLGRQTRAGGNVVNLSSMSRLWVFENGFGPQYLAKIMKGCSKLEKLVMVYTYTAQPLGADSKTDPLWGVLAPVQNALQTLELRLNRWPPSLYTTCYDDLATMFDLPPDVCYPSLAHLHLQITIRGPENPTYNIIDVCNLHGLMDFIRNHKAFPNLRSAHISVKYGEHPGYGIFKGWTLTK